MTYSPSTGLRGLHKACQECIGRQKREAHFFSEPMVSLRDVYWPLRVLMNHFKTRLARSLGVVPCDIAAKSSGRSHQ